jgi:hypothetical protein
MDTTFINNGKLIGVADITLPKLSLSLYTWKPDKWLVVECFFVKLLIWRAEPALFETKQTPSQVNG